MHKGVPPGVVLWCQRGKKARKGGKEEGEGRKEWRKEEGRNGGREGRE